MPDTPAVENGPGWVVIHHPDTGGYAEVTVEAFELAHKDQGWKVAAEYVDPTAPKKSSAAASKEA